MKSKRENGYIIKLYKAINSNYSAYVPRKTDFLVWMNFDGMRIKRIYSFDDYRKSIDIEEIISHEQDNVEMASERQKLYLYHYKKNEKDIFDSQKYKKYPLVIITMINFALTTPEIDILNNAVKSAIDENQKENSNILIDYEILGTLSSHDYVIIFRSNTYKIINKIIFSFRMSQDLVKKEISTTYSILAIEKSNIEYWIGDDELYASIRISLNAKKNPEEIIQKIKGIETSYTTYGKFDIGLEGTLYKQDINSFFELFNKENGIFSGKSADIYMTNTRFLDRKDISLEKKLNKESNVGEKKDLNIETDFGYIQEIVPGVEEARKIIERLNNCSLSDKLKQSFLRLVFRIYQSKISIYSARNSAPFFELLDGMMKYVEKSEENYGCQDDITEIITAVNIMLDNRISANSRDFEMPQSTLRFSGSAFKLLSAYTNVIVDLKQIIDKEDKNYECYAFVAADIDSKVTIESFLCAGESVQLLYIKIPIDIMFNVQYMIPWIAHELGHFLKFDKIFLDRKEAYFQSVFAAFRAVALPYMKRQLPYNFYGVCDIKICPFFSECNTMQECKFLDLDLYSEIVKQYWNIFIIQSGCESTDICKIPENKKREIYEQMCMCCDAVVDAFDEATADMFMIRILNISDSLEYLKILDEYFKNNGISYETDELDLDENIFVRISSVLMFFEGIEDKADIIDRVFNLKLERIIEQAEILNVQAICRKIMEYDIDYQIISFYLCQYLRHFIKEHIDKVLAQKDLKDKKEKICIAYNNIKQGEDFDSYINFVEKYEDENKNVSLQNR